MDVFESSATTSQRSLRWKICSVDRSSNPQASVLCSRFSVLCSRFSVLCLDFDEDEDGDLDNDYDSQEKIRFQVSGLGFPET